LLEYIACGLAVVSSPLPRAVQLLGQSGAGAIVENDAEVISLLRAWSQDRTPVLRHRANARAWAAAQNGWDAQYEEFGNRVKALLQPHTARGPGGSPIKRRATR
jgi:glycosyltransferase involved in cell wall biosynthesis